MWLEKKTVSNSKQQEVKLQMNALSNKGQFKLGLAAKRTHTLQSCVAEEGNGKGEAIAQS